MTKHETFGETGTAGHTHGPHELNAEHMVKTNGVIPRGSVPPPDAERNLPRKPGKKERS